MLQMDKEGDGSLVLVAERRRESQIGSEMAVLEFAVWIVGPWRDWIASKPRWMAS